MTTQEQETRNVQSAFGILLTLDGAGTSSRSLGDLGGTAFAPLVSRLIAHGQVTEADGGYQLTDEGAATLERYAAQAPRPRGWTLCDNCNGRGLVRGPDGGHVVRCPMCDGGSRPL